jgi:hypothetical protein
LRTMPGRRQKTTTGNKLGRSSRSIELPPELEKRLVGELGDRGDGEPEALNSLVVKAIEEYLDRRGEVSPGSVPDRARTVFKSSRGPTGLSVPGQDRSGGVAAESDEGSSREEKPGTSSPPRSQVGTPEAGKLWGREFPTWPVIMEIPGKAETSEPAEVARTDLLSLDEIAHPGVRAVFERSVGRLERSGAALAEVTKGPDFEEAAYRQVRDEILNGERIFLPDVTAGPAVEGDILHAPADRPLFGLHNRDYPSLWALMHLAEAADSGPVPWAEFASGLQLAADPFGGLLVQMDEVERPKLGLKYSSSFPDPEKTAKGGQWIKGSKGRKTARLYPFVKNSFARIQKGGTGVRPEARGPLPRWGAVQFSSRDGVLFVEPTDAGYRLLRATEGASLSLPHSPEASRAFLGYLVEHSPGDTEGFRRVLTAIRDRGERQAVVDANLEFFNGFLEREDQVEDDKFASSMTQGYVARAREWGLLEPGMFSSPEDGRKVYRLTAEGERAIAQLND